MTLYADTHLFPQTVVSDPSFDSFATIEDDETDGLDISSILEDANNLLQQDVEVCLPIVFLEPDPLAVSNDGIQVVGSITAFSKHLTLNSKDFINALKGASVKSISSKTKVHDTSPFAEIVSDCSESRNDSDSEWVENKKQETDESMKLYAYQEDRWMDRYQDLVQFYSSEGHSNVPYTYKNDPGLALWVKRQRHQCKRKKEGRHSNLTQDRIRLLNMLDFNWDSRGNSWTMNYQRLGKFHDEHGHPNVPPEYHSSLANWIKRQKRQYRLYMEKKTSSMTKDRMHKLSTLGFYYETSAPSISNNI